MNRLVSVQGNTIRAATAKGLAGAYLWLSARYSPLAARTRAAGSSGSERRKPPLRPLKPALE